MASRWREWARRRRQSGCSPLCPHRHEAGGEEGFTLIELVVVTVILPVVIGAVVAVMLIVLNDQQSVATRVDASEAAQITSAFYVRDVQSAEYFTTVAGAPVPTTPPVAGWNTTVTQCGPATTGQFLVGMEWNANGGSTATLVSYWDVNSTVSLAHTYDIVRKSCVGAASTTPTSSIVVAKNVSFSSPPVVSVACSGTCPSFNSKWVASTGISGITLAVTQADITNNGNRYDLLGYQYSLVGVPRAWTGGTGGAPAPSLLLTAASETTCSTPGLLCLSSTATLNVTGAIDLDFNYTPGVYLNAGAHVNDPAGPFGVSNCGSCSGVVSGAGTWNAPTTPSSFTPAIQPPTISAPSAVGGGTCTGSLSTASSVVTCPAGTYGALLFNANNVTLNLAGGSSFGGDVGYTGGSYTGDIINFAPGAYTFTAGGLFAAGSGDILECTTCTSTAGVFFFISGTSVVTLTGLLNSFNLPASTTGPYANVLFYQQYCPVINPVTCPSTDSQPMTIDASTNASNADAFGGALIAPAAPLSVVAGTGTLTFENLDVANLTVSGSGAAVSVVP